MTRRSILIAVFFAAAGVLVAWTSWSRTRGPRAFSELDRVYYLSENQSRLEFHASPKASDIGWVCLPASSNSAAYKSPGDPHRLGFVKPEVCGECHSDTLAGFLQTAHFKTSSRPSRKTILGSFEPGANRLMTRDPNLFYEMHAKPEGFFQNLVVRRNGRDYHHSERFDLVIGSGNHGQSYLFFLGDGLYELPVSYFSETGDWINSPGVLYKDGAANFARQITARCMDCHNTYFAHAPDSVNRFDRDRLVLGVTCVRCHGPGWAHVQFHKHNEEESEPRHIVNPANLTRERTDEVCAQCHSGAGTSLAPPLSFRPGEPLERYLSLDMSGDSARNSDPHAANQLARLRKSKCYQQSPKLTCYSCHDPHRHERGDEQLFSRRCLNCHQQPDCGIAAEFGDAITDRCVRCHMPSSRDVAGAMQTADGAMLPLLRDHYIQARTDLAAELIEAFRRTNSPESATRGK